MFGLRKLFWRTLWDNGALWVVLGELLNRGRGLAGDEVKVTDLKNNRGEF